MAVEKKGNISGKIGPVIYRRYQGKTIIQSKPKKIQQTVASRVAATEFGVCSSAARTIRDAFKHLFIHHDGGLVNRMNSAVSKAVRGNRIALPGERDLHDGDLRFLEGFEFNANSCLSSVLLTKPVVSRGEQGEVIVEIPEIDCRKDIRGIPFPRHQPQLRVLVIAFDFRRDYYEYLAEETLVGAGTSIKARRLKFAETVPAGCIVLVGMALEAMENTGYKGMISRNNTQFSPAAIIGAFQSEGNEEHASDYGMKRFLMCAQTPFSGAVQTMGYLGNRLKNNLPEKIQKLQKAGKLRKGKLYK